MIKGDLYIILLLIDKKFLNFTDSLGVESSSSASVSQSSDGCLLTDFLSILCYKPFLDMLAHHLQIQKEYV